MKKAIFEVKSIVQHWGPPFGKEESSKDISVAEGNSFDSHPKEGPIFKLVKLEGERALVEFSEKFTLKGHEHPRNRQVWIDKEEPVSFTYLWGNDGMTKSLLLKGTTSKEEKEPEEDEKKGREEESTARQEEDEESKEGLERRPEEDGNLAEEGDGIEEESKALMEAAP